MLHLTERSRRSRSSLSAVMKMNKWNDTFVMVRQTERETERHQCSQFNWERRRGKNISLEANKKKKSEGAGVLQERGKYGER